MLPQHARLRRREEFRRIYAAGKAYPDSLVVLHVLPLTDRPDECQVGFSVSKKVGVAVIRNQVKRRLREIVKPLLPRIKGGVLLVIAARSRAANADYAEIAASVQRALTRAGLIAPSPREPLALPENPLERPSGLKDGLSEAESPAGEPRA